jgi:hypothetical protein
MSSEDAGRLYGTLKEFFEHIRDRPKFKPTSREALQQGYVAIGKRLDATLPKLFSTLPKAPLEIKPVPALTEKGAARGSYNPGTPDGSRPGVFYFNAYDLPSRTTPGMETLYLHEGAPGHHFQISLAQENEALPKFQRFGNITAFVEGWGLYAETLGRSSASTPTRTNISAISIRSCSARSGWWSTPASSQGLDARPDDPVHPRQQLARAQQRDCGNRALHCDSRPGARLQDRAAQDQRAACPCGTRARPQVRHPRFPRAGADERFVAARRAGSQDRPVDRGEEGRLTPARLRVCVPAPAS